jgi:hypothetical protein
MLNHADCGEKETLNRQIDGQTEGQTNGEKERMVNHADRIHRCMTHPGV